MARKDPAWTAFVEAVRRRCAARGSHAELAERLGVLPTEVADWLRLRSRPPLRELPRIARALGMAPDMLLTEMGLLDGPVTAASDAQLSLEVLELRQRLAEQSIDPTGTTAAGRVMEVAHASGHWAVAMWPAIDGPADVRVHTADQLTFRLLPHVQVTEESSDALLRDDLGALLDLLLATEVDASRTPVWPSAEWSGERHFSIRRHAVPRAPVRVSQVGELSSLLVCSLTSRAWPNSVAALLAEALGYGYTSVGQLVSVHEGPITDRETRHERREEFFGQMLARPPLRYVWSHFAPAPRDGSDAMLRLAAEGWAPGLAVVFLRADDEVLDESLAPSVGEEERERLRRRRQAWDDALSSASAPWVSVVDLEPLGINGSSPQTVRDLRMERSLRIAAVVVRDLAPVTGLTPDRLVRGTPLQRWVSARGDAAFELGTLARPHPASAA